MKSILAGCAILAGSLLADGASEEVVQGRNELGVLAVTTTTKNTIVPIAFTELSDGGEMKIADFVKTQNLKAGDQVMVFTDRDNYETWQLTGEDGSNKTWQKMASISIDAEGKQSQSAGNEAVDVTKAVGSGVWLILGDDRASASNPVTFYLNGKPVPSKTTTTQAGKWNLLGNPNETGSFSGFTPVVGDQIAIPVDNGFRIYRCKAKDDKTQWFYETYSTSEDGKATATKVYEAPSVDATKGLWYYTQKSQTINWNSNN